MGRTLQPSSEPAWRVGIYPPCKLKILCVSQAHGENRKIKYPSSFIQVGPLCALSTLWFAHQPTGCTLSTHEARIHGTDLHTCVSLSPSWGHT